MDWLGNNQLVCYCLSLRIAQAVFIIVTSIPMCELYKNSLARGEAGSEELCVNITAGMLPGLVTFVGSSTLSNFLVLCGVNQINWRVWWWEPQEEVWSSQVTNLRWSSIRHFWPSMFADSSSPLSLALTCTHMDPIITEDGDILGPAHSRLIIHLYL